MSLFKLKRRIKTLLLFFLLLATNLGRAEEIDYEGLKYEINEEASEASCIGLTAYNSIDSKDLIIPEYIEYNNRGIPVISIGEKAFYNCRSFTGSLNIPNSVIEIGEAAFYGCIDFTGPLDIPYSVESIGKEAFYGCSGLTSLSILNGQVGERAFYGCSGLTSLSILNGQVGEWAFYGCTALENLYLGEDIKLFKKYCFAGCSSLKAVTIKSGTVEDFILMDAIY